MTTRKPRQAPPAPTAALGDALGGVMAETLRAVLPDVLRAVLRDELAAVRSVLRAEQGTDSDDRRFLSIDDAAARLSISRDLLYRVLQQEPLLHVKAGSRSLVRWPEVADWMSTRRVIEGRTPRPQPRARRQDAGRPRRSVAKVSQNGTISEANDAPVGEPEIRSVPPDAAPLINHDGDVHEVSPGAA